MEAWVLDQNFNSVAIVDDFESFIWTDRYGKCGDFEEYVSASSTVKEIMKPNYYLWTENSEHMMIIEDITTDTNIEDGNKFIITGRSLESILDRRIIWVQTNLDGDLQNGVKRLINENVINPKIADRKIANFIFKESTDPEITKLKHTAQYTGDNLYEVLCDICETYDIGFKVTLNAEKQFVFELYAGTDRSFKQNTLPYVEFSPEFENIIESNYLESLKTLKNVTLVAGEGEGIDRKTVTVGSGKDLDRRELFTDARDISSKVDDRNLSTAEYNTLLTTRGKEKLAENVITKTFEGEVETSQLFVYGEDFFLGDVVQLVDDFGQEERSRVIEMIMKQDKTGYTAYPTFNILKDEEDES